MNRNFSVGLVVTVAAGILFMTVLMLGQEQALFRPTNHYTVLLPNVEGLNSGSPVKLVGVQVGVIDEIQLPETMEHKEVRVGLTVDRAYADRIRADSQATVKMLSLLGRDKYIELTLGSADQPELPPGSEIRAPLSDLDVIFRQGTTIADDLAQITATLRLVFEKIERQEGLVGRLLMDPEFGSGSIDDITETLASLRRVFARIEEGQGLLGAAIVEPEMRDEFLGNLRSLRTGVEKLVAALEDPATPLGAVMNREGGGAESLENVRAATESLRVALERVERGEGLLGRLISDDEYADRVLGDLEATLRQTASITAKIDRGEGTFGGLVNDPQVYQGLRDVVTGLQDSRLVRWVVRRYGRKGAEKRAAAEP